MTIQNKIQQERYKSITYATIASFESKKATEQRNEEMVQQFTALAKDSEQVAKWLMELEEYRKLGTVEDIKNAINGKEEAVV